MARFEAKCNKGTKSVKFSVQPPPPNLRKATTNDDDNNTIMTHIEEYDAYKPYVYTVDYYDRQKPVCDDDDDENDTSNDRPNYQPMPLHVQDRHEPKFVLPNGIDGSAESLSYYALPDSFVNEIVINTNKYAEARLGKGKFIPAEKHEILGFFAVYYYMGIVKLPAKSDYWTTDADWPSHPFQGEITRNLFKAKLQGIGSTSSGGTSTLMALILLKMMLIRQFLKQKMVNLSLKTKRKLKSLKTTKMMTQIPQVKKN